MTLWIALLRGILCWLTAPVVALPVAGPLLGAWMWMLFLLGPIVFTTDGSCCCGSGVEIFCCSPPIYLPTTMHMTITNSGTLYDGTSYAFVWNGSNAWVFTGSFAGCTSGTTSIYFCCDSSHCPGQSGCLCWDKLGTEDSVVCTPTFSFTWIYNAPGCVRGLGPDFGNAGTTYTLTA